MLKILRHWRDMRKFQALLEKEKHIVFYSEGPTYWVHLEPLVQHLLSDHQVPVCYLSSAPDDPGLDCLKAYSTAFLIGDGAVRNVLFKTLPNSVLVMTMPDLNTFHIKKSDNSVHYVYVHHSINSTHMIYNSHAFDHFDTIFCVGPHHITETRKQEQLYNLPVKNLFKHGYGRLDTLTSLASSIHDGHSSINVGRPLHILLAPSWGNNNLLTDHGEALADNLLREGFHLTIRPHPQTVLQSPSTLSKLRNMYSKNPYFVLEDNVVSAESLFLTDILISDWSGVATEFAYCLERPVLFIDAPRKINNPNYLSLDIEPLEIHIRNVIGSVLSLDSLHKVPEEIKRLNKDRHLIKEKIRKSSNHWIYNRGTSGAKGAKELVKIFNEFN